MMGNRQLKHYRAVIPPIRQPVGCLTKAAASNRPCCVRLRFPPAIAQSLDGYAGSAPTSRPGVRCLRKPSRPLHCAWALPKDLVPLPSDLMKRARKALGSGSWGSAALVHRACSMMSNVRNAARRLSTGSSARQPEQGRNTISAARSRHEVCMKQKGAIFSPTTSYYRTGAPEPVLFFWAQRRLLQPASQNDLQAIGLEGISQCG
jgi:hypothetical protein